MSREISQIVDRLDLQPTPLTMVEIWLTEAEDLLLELSVSPDNSRVHFRLLAICGRLQALSA